MAILAVSVALSYGVRWVPGQAGQPTTAEKRSATTITLPPSPKALLPEVFDGWVTAEPSKVLADPVQADAANAAALKEYGFTMGLAASYKREGETLTIRALRFDDTSGAYGAYTYYRQNGWPKEAIGTGAASNHNRVLFWKGITVVDATFSRIGPMSAGEMREIARQLPASAGNRALAPPILASLPQASLDGADDALRAGTCGVCGSWRRSAALARGLRQGRRNRDGQLFAGLWPGYAHHHRLPDAADRRGAGDRDSRLPEGRQPGPASLAASR